MEFTTINNTLVATTYTVLTDLTEMDITPEVHMALEYYANWTNKQLEKNLRNINRINLGIVECEIEGTTTWFDVGEASVANVLKNRDLLDYDFTQMMTAVTAIGMTPANMFARMSKSVVLTKAITLLHLKANEKN